MRFVIFLIILFYFLALLESSFLVHFSFFNFFPNIILIIVVLINLFERLSSDLGILSAAIGGFFLDIFANPPFYLFSNINFFGFYIVNLIILAIFVKFVIGRYIQLPHYLNYGQVS